MKPSKAYASMYSIEESTESMRGGNMDRVTWTDERLDDLSRRVDSGFERLDADMRVLRGELSSGLSDVRNEIAEFRSTMVKAFIGIGGGIIVSLIGVIAAVLANGG